MQQPPERFCLPTRHGPARPQIAVVLALLIKSDYPEVWSDAFEQLHSLLIVGSGGSGGGGGGGGDGAAGRSVAAARARVELYLRVLCALDEEVVSFHVDRSREEADHNSLIKVRVCTRVCVCVLHVVYGTCVCVCGTCA